MLFYVQAGTGCRKIIRRKKCPQIVVDSDFLYYLNSSGRSCVTCVSLGGSAPVFECSTAQFNAAEYHALTADFVGFILDEVMLIIGFGLDATAEMLI